MPFKKKAASNTHSLARILGDNYKKRLNNMGVSERLVSRLEKLDLSDFRIRILKKSELSATEKKNLALLIDTALSDLKKGYHVPLYILKARGAIKKVNSAKTVPLGIADVYNSIGLPDFDEVYILEHKDLGPVGVSLVKGDYLAYLAVHKPLVRMLEETTGKRLNPGTILLLRTLMDKHPMWSMLSEEGERFIKNLKKDIRSIHINEHKGKKFFIFSVDHETLAEMDEKARREIDKYLKELRRILLR